MTQTKQVAARSRTEEKNETQANRSEAKWYVVHTYSGHENGGPSGLVSLTRNGGPSGLVFMRGGFNG